MPRKNKRNKTPPPSDEEPRFFTVHHPYPLNANMELDSDQRNMILWLACCTGKDALAALYHKPRSGNMVIIEVNRSFTDMDKLLGRHHWEEFLRNPADDEKERYSSIYHCTMNSVREVSKYGWKRIVVEEFWFSVWRLDNELIVQPYPPTTFCSTPIEDQTAKPLCRPLPSAVFPPPPPPTSAFPPPPVGSKEWFAMKDSGFTPEPLNSKSKKAKALTAAKTPSSNSVPNAWKKGSPLVPAGSVTPRDLQLGAKSSVPANLSYARGSSSSSAFGPTEWPKTPDLIPSSSRVKSPTSDSISSADSQSVQTPLDQGTSVYMDGTDFEQAMSSVMLDDEYYGEDYEDDVWDMPAPPSVTAEVEPQPAEEEITNYWADYGKYEEPKPQDDLCPAHGKLCRKGICADYAEKKRKLKRQKENEERKEERDRKAAKREEKNKKGKGTQDASSGHKFNFTAKKPDHLAAGPWKAEDPPKASSDGTTKTTGARDGPKPIAQAPTPISAPATPATTKGGASAPPPSAPPPAAPRPARGRKMNTTNGNPVRAAETQSPTSPQVIPPKSASGDSGWGHIVKAPWDPSSRGAPSVAPASTSGWGKVAKAPWDASTQASSVVGGEKGGSGHAPSIAASSTGGWGHVPKAPWDAASNAASSVGVSDKGKKGKKKKDKAPSVAASSTGGWGPVSKAPWDPASTRAPSLVGDDDDTKTVNGDTLGEVTDWNDRKGDANGRSWADEVEEQFPEG